MPDVPYTAEEFTEVLNKNAGIYDEYVNGAEVIKGSGQLLSEAVDSFQTQAVDLIDQMTAFFGGLIVPNVLNASNIVPTGSYATSTYYDLKFGVKIAYGAEGDIYIIMKGGTTTAYEYLHFIADVVPEGVTIETSNVTTSSSYVTGWPGFIQVGIIHGVTGKINISLVMDSYDATYDYTNVKVTVTPV